MKELLAEIRGCRKCEATLPHGVRPILQASPSSQIVIFGQAPGRRVHESGVPWDDPSGVRLRNWLGVTEANFYDPELIALIPLGFCYPGTGKSGDLAPRPECAPLWHERVLASLSEVQLTLLVGSYAQRYYLSSRCGVTETVRNWDRCPAGVFPLPHPSPRNNIWLKRNPWFELEVLPELRRRVKACLEDINS